MVVWDNGLSQLIGRHAPSTNKGGSQEEEEDMDDDEAVEDDDDAMEDDDEPAMPEDQAAQLDEAGLEYHPNDPTGLRLGQLSMNDGERYHLMKAACVKAGKLEEWREDLVNTVVRLSGMLSTKSLTNSRSKKAVKKVLEDLQRYVGLHYDHKFQHAELIQTSISQSICMDCMACRSTGSFWGQTCWRLLQCSIRLSLAQRHDWSVRWKPC